MYPADRAVLSEQALARRLMDHPATGPPVGPGHPLEDRRAYAAAYAASSITHTHAAIMCRPGGCPCPQSAHDGSANPVYGVDWTLCWVKRSAPQLGHCWYESAAKLAAEIALTCASRSAWPRLKLPYGGAKRLNSEPTRRRLADLDTRQA